MFIKRGEIVYLNWLGHRILFCSQHLFVQLVLVQSFHELTDILKVVNIFEFVLSFFLGLDVKDVMLV